MIFALAALLCSCGGDADKAPDTSASEDVTTDNTAEEGTTASSPSQGVTSHPGGSN